MKLQIGIDGKTYEVDVEVIEDDELPRMPNYGPYIAVPSTVQSARAPLPTPSPAEDEKVEENKVCRSPVAGVVIRVNVQPGQQIGANDLMMVLEAMKMETNITAPISGKVKSMRAKAGDSVKINQIVADFE
ncbi:MAG TPA: biotin/lipoyl-containing protein [Terriglobales bacterium]|nr:biotin/lipoyl-containing protein [Terriglobales bacterium]